MSETNEQTETRESWVFMESAECSETPEQAIEAHLDMASIDKHDVRYDITRVKKDTKPNRFGYETGTVWFTLRLSPADAVKWDTDA